MIVMRLVPVAIVAALMSSALAAQSNEQGALDQMRHFPSYQQTIQKVYQDYESGLSTHCPKIDLDMGTARARVLSPLQLNVEGHIVNGGWTEGIEGSACGEHRRYKALVVFKDGQPAVYPALPGDSYASPVLQRDAMLQVAGVVGAAGASCQPDVIDTTLPDGEPQKAGMPWTEHWTVRSCEKRYLVPMHFVPDATGTGINVKPAEVVELPGTGG